MIKKALSVISIFIFAIIFFSLVLCLISAISPIFMSSANSKITIEHLIKISWFTFYQSFLSTILAILIGVPAAFFCGRRRFLGRNFLLSLSSIPLCIPSLIVALGFVSIFGISGESNKILKSIFSLNESPIKFLYSFVGLIIAQGFYNFPIIMKTVSDTWENIPNDKAEAARLLGASESRIFRTITIYQILPSIISASIPVFIFCFMSFMLVLLFGAIGCSTLEVEIYRARNMFDFKGAGMLSLVETVLASSIIFLQCAIEKKSLRIKGFSNKLYFSKLKMNGFLEYFSFTFLFILILIFFLSPIFGIIQNSFTSSNSKTTGFTFYSFKRIFLLKGFFNALKGTASTSFFTGILCVICGFVYSVFLKSLEFKRISNSLFKVFPMIPMAISSIVIGLGITILIKSGNVISLIIAQTTLSWPIAFRQIHSQISKISKNTIESAIMLSKNSLDLIFRIYIPLSIKGIFSAFGFCFAISVGDTTLPLILSIPNFDTLALFTYRLAGAYKYHEACASGLILGIICVGIFALSKKIKDVI